MEVTTGVVLSRTSGAQVETHTLDLSASGLLLPGPPDLRPDERVWVAIDVGEAPPVRARGVVVRVTANNRKGVRFDQIDESARERLIRYLFVRQRLAARVRDR
jgi:c-di-GMP-binding flagellar brake protein YcgR